MELATSKRAATEAAAGVNQERLKAVVLAGGLGAAKCSVMDAYASLLFPIMDCQPLLHHLLGQLLEHGIREVAVTLSADGGRSDRLIDELSRIPPSELTVHWQIDDGNRGAGGALKDLEWFLSSGPALVLHPSVWLEGFEFDALWNEHRARRSTVTMVLEAAARSRGDLDNVDLDAEGVVKRYSNLHVSRDNRRRLRPAGIYLVEPDILDFVEPGRYVDLNEQLLGWLNEDGYPVRGYVIERSLNRFEDSSQYFDLNRRLMLAWWSQQEWRGQGATAYSSGVHCMEGTQVSDSARIIGPVVIGRNCTIEQGALIIGPTLVCDGTTVESDALIRDSVIWRDSHIGSGACVEYSLLTERCRIGAQQRVLGVLVEDAGATIKHLALPVVANMPPGAGSLADAERIVSASRSLSRMGYLLIKRTLDVVAPIVTLPLLAPVLLLTALAIKLDSPGPVLFRQKMSRGCTNTAW